MNRDYKSDIKTMIIWYVLSRIILMVILGVTTGFNLSGLFDCEHYIGIAKNGYTEDLQYAFFPLIPLIIRYLGVWGSVLLNQLAVAGITFCLYKIAKEQFNLEPVMVCKMWLVCPIAMFTIICYTEPIFILCTISAYYLYKHQRNYILAGIMLGLAVMSRSMGSLLFFSLFIFMVINIFRKKEEIVNVFKMYIPATIISCLYPAYLYVQTGNWKLFADIQYTSWNKKHTNLFLLAAKAPEILKISHLLLAAALIISGICIFKGKNKKYRDLYIKILVLATLFSMVFGLKEFDYVFVMTLIFYLLVMMVLRRKDKDNYDLYLYLIMSIIITSSCRRGDNATVSYYRYIFACFPTFFLLPQKEIILFLECCLLMVFAVFFYGGVYSFESAMGSPGEYHFTN